MQCKCYHTDFPGYSVCWGTREREPCECGGDESKCDFYEEVRQRAARDGGTNNMTVKDALDLIGYGERFILKGAATGQIYHKSYANTNAHLEPLLNKEVTDSPFFTTLYTSNSPSCAYTYPVIGIWILG